MAHFVISQHKLPRLIVKDSQPEETESFEKFFAEFLELSFPDYYVSPSDSLIGFNLPLDEREKRIFYRFHTNFNFVIYDGNEKLLSVTVLSINLLARHLTSDQREQINSELTDCGERANGEQCYAFVHEDYGICYEIALNNGYSLVTSFDYCPAKTSFSTRQEQIAYYLFEAFLSLEIPDELIE